MRKTYKKVFEFKGQAINYFNKIKLNGNLTGKEMYQQGNAYYVEYYYTIG